MSSAFDLKERIAMSREFSVEEKVFLQEAINAAARKPPGSGGAIEIDRSNPTWRKIPADKVLEAGAKRCPTCGAGL